MNYQTGTFYHETTQLPVLKKLAAYLFENTDSYAEIATFIAIDFINHGIDGQYVDIQSNFQTTDRLEEYVEKYLDLVNKNNDEEQFLVLSQENLEYDSKKNRHSHEIRRVVVDVKNNLIKGLLCGSVEDEVIYTVRAIGTKEFAESIRAVAKDVRFESTTRTIYKVTGYDQDGGFRQKNHVVKLSNLRRAMDEFYPYWKEGSTVKSLIEDFVDSDNNVMILYGAPGTGKSTLTAHIAGSLPTTDQVIVIDNIAVLSDPRFAGAISEEDDVRLFIFEEADMLLGKRTEGNTFMSTLLNSTDGIIPNKTKYIFTTNKETLDDIDHAILRSGRLHSVIHFDFLTKEEANVARAAIGRESLDQFVDVDGVELEEIPLSEALTTKRIDVSDRGDLPTAIHGTAKKRAGFF